MGKEICVSDMSLADREKLYNKAVSEILMDLHYVSALAAMTNRSVLSSLLTNVRESLDELFKAWEVK